MISLTIILGCDKKNPTSSKSFTPLTGSWSGTDISFAVVGDPLSVSNLSLTYSGHASGSYCSFDYKSTTTLSKKMDIEDNSFSYSSSSLTIEGSFSSSKNSEINISWTVYDSYCRAYYSGSKTYTASYYNLAKTINSVSSEISGNVEIIELIDEESKTCIRKIYEKVK